MITLCYFSNLVRPYYIKVIFQTCIVEDNLVIFNKCSIQISNKDNSLKVIPGIRFMFIVAPKNWTESTRFRESLGFDGGPIAA